MPHIIAHHNWARKPKIASLDNNLLSLMHLLDEDVKMLNGTSYNTNNIDKLIPGNIYSISTPPVEGVEFDKLYFRLYSIVDEYKGANINSVIVREVCIGENGEIIENVNISGRRKFSLSPSMCKMFGIGYVQGLELWPKNSGFKRVYDEINAKNKDINYGNMSTYPTSKIDNTIRSVILELHGFSPYNSSHIITPTGAMIPTYDFISSLTVFVKQNISTDNGCAGFKIGDRLPFKIVSRTNNTRSISICDDKHNIYLEVDLTKKSHNVNTSDGIIGVSHTALEGKDIDDIIEISWDESSDENNKNEKKMSDDDIDRVFDALDKHFSAGLITSFNRYSGIIQFIK